MVANTSANIPTTHIKTLNPTFRFEKAKQTVCMAGKFGLI